MKKVRKLGFLGILSALTVVLFLAGISLIQAQVPTKGKPIKPPEATWAVRIPTSGSGVMFYGNAGYYENNGANIQVSVKKGSPGAYRSYYKFVYAFDFTLANENVGTGTPPDYQVGFQNVNGLYDVSYPDEGKPHCQFPYVTLGAPDCMADFLNNTHPYSDLTGEHDYQYFWTRVNVFDKDIELMGIGETYLFGSASDPGEPGDYLEMVARYRNDCFPEPAYHDVEITRNINYWRAVDEGNPLNITIERLDEAAYEIECAGVWRIHILPVDNRSILGFLNVQERFCTIEKRKTKWYYPLEAKGCFDFYIDFIKNPTAQ